MHVYLAHKLLYIYTDLFLYLYYNNTTIIYISCIYLFSEFPSESRIHFCVAYNNIFDTIFYSYIIYAYVACGSFKSKIYSFFAETDINKYNISVIISNKQI